MAQTHSISEINKIRLKVQAAQNCKNPWELPKKINSAVDDLLKVIDKIERRTSRLENINGLVVNKHE